MLYRDAGARRLRGAAVEPDAERPAARVAPGVSGPQREVGGLGQLPRSRACGTDFVPLVEGGRSREKQDQAGDMSQGPAWSQLPPRSRRVPGGGGCPEAQTRAHRGARRRGFLGQDAGFGEGCDSHSPKRAAVSS